MAAAAASLHQSHAKAGMNGDMTSSIKTPMDHTAKPPSLSLSRLTLLAFGLVLMAGMNLTTPARADDTLPVDAAPLDLPLSPMRDDTSSADAPPLAAPAPTPAPEAKETTQDRTQAPEPAILRILFEGGDATLSDDARAALITFAKTFKARGGRVALKGYAGTPGSTSSNARRLSLRRVLTVRTLLLAQGISADQLEVRALGGVRDAGPEGRVDIVKSSR